MKSKKHFAKQLLSMLLLFSLVLSGLASVKLDVRAEGNDGTLSQQTDMENDDSVSEDGPTAEIINPYVNMYVAEDLKLGLLESRSIKTEFKVLDENNVAKGVLISGNNKNIKKATLTYTKKIDFGTGEATLIRVDGLAKAGSKIYVEFYLDDESTPFARKQLSVQPKADQWERMLPIYAETESGKAVGQHTVTVKLNDETTADDKKTQILLRSIKFYKKSVPTVYVNIDESLGSIAAMNNSKDHSVNCYGDIEIKVPTGYNSGYSDKEYTGGKYHMEYIRGRGNSTWDTTKKPYKIKLDSKEDLFGMGKNKHWALIANYYDPTLLRNRITYYLGAAMGMEYTPKLVPVDVVMNGKYLGSYFLSEVVRIDKSRVDIDNLEEIEEDDDNITGGYLLGMAPYGDEEGYQFNTNKNVPFVVESPEKLENEEDTRIDEMNKYIEDYMNKIEDCIYGENFEDEEGHSYTDYMDLDSAAKYFLFQSFTKNGDAYITPSTKLYKKKDGKLYWGPLWDFDFVAWQYDSEYDTFDSSFGWFNRLTNDPKFVEAVRKAWNGVDENDTTSMKYQINEVIKEGGVLDKYIEEMLPSIEANFDVIGSSSTDYWKLLEYDEENNEHVDTGENDDEEINDAINEDGQEDVVPGAAAQDADEPIIVDNYGYGDDPYGNEEEPSVDEFGPIYNVEIVRYTTEDDYKKIIEEQREWIRKRLEWVDENIMGDFKVSGDDGIHEIEFYDGDELVYSETVFSGGQVENFPETPKKEGYYFAGWYYYYEITDEEGNVDRYEEPVSPSDNYYESYKIYTKWVKKEDVIATKKIIVPYEEVNLSEFGMVDIKYTIIPEEADENIVLYSTSDSSIAMIDSRGTIYAPGKAGDATITLTTIDGVSTSFVVHVYEKSEIQPLDKVGFTESKIELKVGEIGNVALKYLPEAGEYSDVRILNGDPDIATLSKTGAIYAISEGTAKIFVSLPDSEDFEVLTVVVKADEDESASDNDDNKETVNPDKDKENKDSAGKDTTPQTDKKETGKTTDTQTQSAAVDALTVSIIKKGQTFNYGKLSYEVVSECKMSGGKVVEGQVQVNGYKKSEKNKNTTLSIPATVTYKNNSFKVVSVKAEAFKKCTKIKKVTIGKNVTSVGDKAFYGCKKLSQVAIKGEKCAFGKSVFGNVSKKVNFTVPGKALSTYRKTFKKMGFKKSQVK